MTKVTVSDLEITAEGHVGSTGVCIAVSAIVQTAERILNNGKALKRIEVNEEYAYRKIVCDVGALPPYEQGITRVLREDHVRRGRRAFIDCVFDGVLQTLRELAAIQNPQSPVLEICDTRKPHAA